MYIEGKIADFLGDDEPREGGYSGECAPGDRMLLQQYTTDDLYKRGHVSRILKSKQSHEPREISTAIYNNNSIRTCGVDVLLLLGCATVD